MLGWNYKYSDLYSELEVFVLILGETKYLYSCLEVQAFVLGNQYLYSAAKVLGFLLYSTIQVLNHNTGAIQENFLLGKKGENCSDSGTNPMGGTLESGGGP